MYARVLVHLEANRVPRCEIKESTRARAVNIYVDWLYPLGLWVLQFATIVALARPSPALVRPPFIPYFGPCHRSVGNFICSHNSPILYQFSIIMRDKARTEIYDVHG